MKIITQTDGEMVLKEGSASGIIFGIIFAIVGAVVAFYFSSSGQIVVWLGIAFIAIGLASIFFSSSITVDINKSGGQLSYQKKHLIGGSSAAYAVADVLRVETRKEWRMQNNANKNVSMPRQVLVSQSVIVFKNGQELPLDHQKNSSSMSVGPVMMTGQGKEVATATQVANFMGVPFQEIAPPNSGAGINIGGSGGIQL
jgi:cation transport ATPase